jgi:AraC-like DNA-binding protein
MAFASGERIRRPRVSKHEAVKRAEAYLHAHMDAPLPLPRLCRLLGLSERSLRNAFYGVRGMSPTRSMRVERLAAARRALSERRSRGVTVTTVATGCGFYELGRFAAAYKQVFGEVPSETLRSRHNRRLQQAANRKDDPCSAKPT